MKYQKKPVVVEAFQITEETRWKSHLWPNWLWYAWYKPIKLKGRLRVDSTDVLWLSTLEGEHKVMPNDWIIQGAEGELYLCKPEVFEATYEPYGTLKI